MLGLALFIAAAQGWQSIYTEKVNDVEGQGGSYYRPVKVYNNIKCILFII